MNARDFSRRHGLQPLAAYAVDDTTGFVPSIDPLRCLPSAFEAWENIASEIPGLIRSRQLRAVLKDMPILDVSELVDAREQERALLMLAVFANAWVWGGAEPIFRIPRQVAIPLCAIAGSLDRPAIVHYGSMALNNWYRINKTKSISTDNIHTQLLFLGGVDEDWFFVASIGVELASAPLLPSIHAATLASRQSDDANLAEIVNRIADGMDAVLTALNRMREWCDPHVFYHRVRPYLTGWPTEGAIYEGVSEIPRKYWGGSAGQSSSIQIIDALLGVIHTGDMSGSYLREMRQYMPVPHRHFILDVERESHLRARAASGSVGLRDAYNSAVSRVDLFRRRHLAMAHEYVSKPAGMGPGVKGTGGTTFAEFLKDAQVETEKTKL